MKLHPDLFAKTQRDAYISDAMTAHKVPGLAMAVLRDGKTEIHCYGTADSAGTPVTASTVFEAASLTKTLFACLALRLADAGVLDLDAPMAPQLPELKLSNDARMAAVTPRLALCHGTGLPNWADKPLPFRFDPGQGFGYSGEGYYCLQRLIERLTGKDLPTLLEEHFFAPWAMESSSGIWHPGLPMAHGFDAQGKVCKVRDSVDDTGNAPEPNSAWSLYTTAPGYGAYAARVLAGDIGLRPETLEAMATPQNSADAHIAWGLGWGLVKASPGVLWHWGDNTGFKSLVVLDRRSGCGLVLFTNSDNGTAFTLQLAQRFSDGDFFGPMADFIATAE